VAPDQVQPLGQLHEEMSSSLKRAARTDVDQVLNHHGL
jgi:hypothetical protein